MMILKGYCGISSKAQSDEHLDLEWQESQQCPNWDAFKGAVMRWKKSPREKGQKKAKLGTYLHSRDREEIQYWMKKAVKRNTGKESEMCNAKIGLGRKELRKARCVQKYEQEQRSQVEHGKVVIWFGSQLMKTFEGQSLDIKRFGTESERRLLSQWGSSLQQTGSKGNEELHSGLKNYWLKKHPFYASFKVERGLSRLISQRKEANLL